MQKIRIDQLLVDRGIAQSRERARALVLAGKVYLADKRIEKAGDAIAFDAEIQVRGEDHAYVSRGGVKLEGALGVFGLDVTGFVCADFGASTGGFSDCLLQRGATRIYAIDVGYGQLHEKLRQDPRVVIMDRTNARTLDPESLPEKVDLVVIDASFIGMEKLLPSAHAVLREEGFLVAMIKPQFEVGKANLKKGVVRDLVVRKAAIERVVEGARTVGFEIRGVDDSVLPGPDGNVEAFMFAQRKKREVV